MEKHDCHNLSHINPSKPFSSFRRVPTKQLMCKYQNKGRATEKHNILAEYNEYKNGDR